MLKNENDLRAFFIMLALCTLLLSSCGSSEGASAASKDIIDDPLIAESRETRAHLRETIERAQQYLPDKGEDEQSSEANSEVSVSSEEDVDEDEDLPSPSEDYNDDDSYANDEPGIVSNTDSNGNVPSDYNAAENSVITSNANQSSGFGAPDSVSTSATTLQEETGNNPQNTNDANNPTESSPSTENSNISANGGGNPNIGDYESTPTDKGPYVVNKKNGKIHINTCRTLPEEDNRAYFSTMDEVRAAGYSDLCGNCLEN